jgi:hypothetical protein
MDVGAVKAPRFGGDDDLAGRCRDDVSGRFGAISDGRRGSALSSVNEPPSALRAGQALAGRPGDVLAQIGTEFQRIVDAESSAGLERSQLLAVDRQRNRRARTRAAATELAVSSLWR